MKQHVDFEITLDKESSMKQTVSFCTDYMAKPAKETNDNDDDADAAED